MGIFHKGRRLVPLAVLTVIASVGAIGSTAILAINRSPQVIKKDRIEYLQKMDIDPDALLHCNDIPVYLNTDKLPSDIKENKITDSTPTGKGYVTMHEVMHTLGFDHRDEEDTVMQPTFGPGVTATGPNKKDQKILETLYPKTNPKALYYIVKNSDEKSEHMIEAGLDTISKYCGLSFFKVDSDLPISTFNQVSYSLPKINYIFNDNQDLMAQGQLGNASITVNFNNYKIVPQSYINLDKTLNNIYWKDEEVKNSSSILPTHKYSTVKDMGNAEQKTYQIHSDENNDYTFTNALKFYKDNINNYVPTTKKKDDEEREM